MGAWGAGPFENDDALDFVVDLSAASDWAVVTEAIDRVVNAPEAACIEAPEASAALAAAEVIAAALDAPLAELPPEVTAWVAAQAPSVTPEVARKAYQATQRVASGSELADL